MHVVAILAVQCPCTAALVIAQTLKQRENTSKTAHQAARDIACHALLAHTRSAYQKRNRAPFANGLRGRGITGRVAVVPAQGGQNPVHLERINQSISADGTDCTDDPQGSRRAYNVLSANTVG